MLLMTADANPNLCNIFLHFQISKLHLIFGCIQIENTK